MLSLHSPYSKLQRYSPSEPVKVWDKPLHRKISKTPFKPPECVLKRIKDHNSIVDRCNGCGDEAIKTRKSLIFEYLDVGNIYKQLYIVFVKYIFFRVHIINFHNYCTTKNDLNYILKTL